MILGLLFGRYCVMSHQIGVTNVSDGPIPAVSYLLLSRGVSRVSRSSGLDKTTLQGTVKEGGGERERS